MKLSRNIFLISLLFFSTTTLSFAQGIPQSPTLKANFKRDGRSNYATNIEKPHVKWRFDTGDGVESSPAIGADGTIYVGTFTDHFFALNPDGSVKWKYTRENTHFRSSPTIGKDGTIYVPATYISGSIFSAHLGKETNSGTVMLLALNPNGNLKWEFTLGGVMSGILYAPAISPDGTIYMISGGAKMPGAIGGDKFWAINPDGTSKWSFNVEDACYSAPALADDGTIYFGCADGNFYALYPNGKEKWRFNTGPGAKQREDIYDSVPSIGPDGTVYIGSYDKHVYAFTPEGQVKWKFKTNEKVEATPSIGPDGTIYIGTYSPGKDKNLYAVSPEGKEKWRFETGEGVYGAPVIDTNGIIYFGSYDGNLYSLNTDGSERWRFTTQGGVTLPPALGADGTVYVGSWDNHLYAIDGKTGPVIAGPGADKVRNNNNPLIPIIGITIVVAVGISFIWYKKKRSY